MNLNRPLQIKMKIKHIETYLQYKWFTPTFHFSSSSSRVLKKADVTPGAFIANVDDGRLDSCLSETENGVSWDLARTRNVKVLKGYCDHAPNVATRHFAYRQSLAGLVS